MRPRLRSVRVSGCERTVLSSRGTRRRSESVFYSTVEIYATILKTRIKNTTNAFLHAGTVRPRPRAASVSGVSTRVTGETNTRTKTDHDGHGFYFSSDVYVTVTGNPEVPALVLSTRCNISTSRAWHALHVVRHKLKSNTFYAESIKTAFEFFRSRFYSAARLTISSVRRQRRWWLMLLMSFRTVNVRRVCDSRKTIRYHAVEEKKNNRKFVYTQTSVGSSIESDICRQCGSS